MKWTLDYGHLIAILREEKSTTNKEDKIIEREHTQYSSLPNLNVNLKRASWNWEKTTHFDHCVQSMI